MEVTCSNCEKKINVPDEKVPAGKAFSLRCPGCKSKISIDLSPSAADSKPAVDSGWSQQTAAGEEAGSYDASEKPFDFLEEEGLTAMVCEEDPEVVNQIRSVLELMEYNVTVPANIRDALRKMKYHVYDMILVNEVFDGSEPDSNGILIYLERLNMAVRRNVFVGLLTSRHTTMDNMAAFLKSVNVTINLKDIGSLDRILSRGINENQLFYTVFQESMKKTGRI
ncbi:MAG: zinc-ribbon domain-containing protein [Thermodesulfobacteriota bacterium]